MQPRGGNSAPVLFFSGPGKETPLSYLAMGYKAHQYVVDITVDIEDFFGEYTTVNLGVQVNTGVYYQSMAINVKLESLLINRKLTCFKSIV